MAPFRRARGEAMTTIRETRLDVATMTLLKRVMPDGALSEIPVLCHVDAVADSQDMSIDAALLAFDWTGAQGVYVLDRATLAIAPQGMPPSAHHVWDWTTLAWVDPRTLEDLKAAQWALIKRARDAAEQAGFVWDGSSFDCDPTSQSRIQGGALMATTALLNSAPFAIEWTLADNTTRTLDAAQMIAVGLAMGQHIDSTHQIGRALRAQLAAATTAEEVAAVEWPA